MRNLKKIVFVPQYGRSEYTRKCMESLASDGCEYHIFTHKGDQGLRNAIIDFINYVEDKDYDIIAKMDNDCTVPKGWLNTLVEVMEEEGLDMVSPNVHPSNAAFVHGRAVQGARHRKAETIGGLWCMRKSLIEGLNFKKDLRIEGIRGAISLLKLIIAVKNPKLGWVPEVVVQDIGHWSGEHPEHIKSTDHERYSEQVGREIAWRA